MGPETQYAIRKYQRDHDLKVTGTLDASTARSLTERS